MSTQRYTFEEAPFSISAIPSDGDVIIGVQNFPMSTTFYLTKADALALAEQIKAAAMIEESGNE